LSPRTNPEAVRAARLWSARPVFRLAAPVDRSSSFILRSRSGPRNGLTPSKTWYAGRGCFDVRKRKQKPSVRAIVALAVATFLFVVICGLNTSAGNVIGGTGGALRLAWRVEG
jgi:hypothetical protein